MVVCRYFLENKCRFGENCKFEHPRGDVQRNLFGQPRDNWGGNNSANQGNKFNKWSGESTQQTSAGGTHTPAIDLINNLPREMEIWESSKMWPFSCLSMERDIESLPGFYDVSTEELRTEAYIALKAGNIQPYVEKIQSLNADFQNKRQHLKHLSPDMKQKLVSLLEELRKKRNVTSSQPTSSFSQPTQPSSGSLFGNPPGPTNPSNPFGQTPQENKASSGLFGKPAFTSTPGAASAGSLFGNQTATSFGNSSGTGLFNSQPATGANQSNPFAPAATANSGQSLFGGGGASSNSSQSIFGGSSGQQANPAATNLFGGGANPAPQGLFGKPASTPTPGGGGGLFGNSGAGKNPSIMGANPSIMGAGAATGFAATSPLNQNPGLLGASPSGFAPVSTNQGQAQPTSLFGKPFSGGGGAGAAPPPTGLFGKPPGQGLFGSAQGASSGHGQSIMSSGGQGQSIMSSGGQGQSIMSSGGQGQSIMSSGAPPTDASAGVYTLLDQLTEFEKAEFKATAFTLGKIPLRPPARELINV